MSERRVTFTNLDNAHDVGPFGSNAAQLFVKDGKLWAQLQGKTAVELADLGAEATGSPVGTVVTFGGSTEPAGWLTCDGSSYSRATYADLFGVISTTYGAPTGTTFLVPDLRGRAPLGAGTGSGLTARSLGALGGYEDVTLAAGEIPAHGHGVTDGGHGHGVTDGGHTHGISESTHSHTFNGTSHSHGGVPSGISTSSGSRPEGSAGWSSHLTSVSLSGSTNTGTEYADGSISSDYSGVSGSSGSSGTGVSVDTSSTGISVQNTGGGGSHSNMSPWVALTYLIKA